MVQARQEQGPCSRIDSDSRSYSDKQGTQQSRPDGDPDCSIYASRSAELAKKRLNESSRQGAQMELICINLEGMQNAVEENTAGMEAFIAGFGLETNP